MHSDEIHLPSYPVLSLQPAIRESLEQQLIPVIEAPPGSGKSSLVPFFLLNEEWRGERTILLLQPRRPAVRALAARLGELGGGRVKVGYITRYEHFVPRKPDIIVMTEGIFVRRLLEDPGAEDTAAVILDEFHERSLATDLAYVLARQCREVFRPDLRLLVMSATLNTEQFSTEIFSLVRAEGTLHPLSIHYRPLPGDRTGHRTRIEEHGAEECYRRIADSGGSILFFLPGEAEIHRAAEILRSSSLPEGVEVHPLYGRLSPREQARAIARPGKGRRKIVIATNIAETSLTIEGISCVVDSGLRRRSTWNGDTGLSRLHTVRISAASAAQRAGRAGRLGPGKVVRLWDQNERLVDFDPPEILEADLSGMFLTLSVWGDTEGRTLPWPDPPAEERRTEALKLLRELEALDDQRIPTKKGEAMARMPVAPRLAAMLIEAAGTSPGTKTDTVAGSAALTTAFIAAILEHGDPLRPEARELYGANLELRIELLKSARNRKTPGSPVDSGNFPQELSRGATERVLKEAARLEGLVAYQGCTDNPGKRGSNRKFVETSPADASSKTSSPGALLLTAYPDRIARRTGGGRYRLASGPEARLIEGDRGFSPEWIVAAALHRGQREGLIYLAAALSEEEVRNFVHEHAREEEYLSIDETGALKARRLRILGTSQGKTGSGLVVSTTPIGPAEMSSPGTAFLELLKQEGISKLSWSRGAEELRRRIAYLREVRGEKWPDVSDKALQAGLEKWLTPFLPSRLKQNSLKDLPLAKALRLLLPWELQGRVEELAPEQLTLPSGTRRRLRYEGDRCILAARIQQLFGLSTTPKVAGVPVEVELLSPSGRPVQVTRDLSSFWRHTYPEVRKELRGRYPKHFWPEDPFTAEATDRSKPKQERR